MPFLRLTRDRRGAEHTFLMHAAHPGERPKVLYWYRTAPDLQTGRSPLDEEAIRTIEEQHPDIDFDWPAILALSEAMMPEEEAAPARPQKLGRPRPPRGRERPEVGARQRPGPPPVSSAEASLPPPDQDEAPVDVGDGEEDRGLGEDEAEAAPIHTHALLEELVGREIATRLHARHAEICARIHERHPEGEAREAWLQRAEAIDPNTWLTPEAVLQGVRSADGMFERLRRELMA